MEKKYSELLNLDATIAKDLFDKVTHPWEVLPLIHDYIIEKFDLLGDDFIEFDSNVYIHKTAKISDKATIIGPTIIGRDTEVRPGAFIRGNALIGEGCVIGNSTEVKNAIIFNHVQCPHYNYIGDAVLGEYAHTGAGVILSNVKNDKSNVCVKDKKEVYETGLRKFSAIIGDHVDVGCNSVVFPGSIIYPNTLVYPLTRVRGVVPSNKIVKDTYEIVERKDN